VWQTLARDDRLRAWELVVETAQSSLTRGEAWMVSRVSEEGTREISAMVEASQSPHEVVERTAWSLAARGMVTVDHGLVAITPEGDAEAQRLLEAQRRRLRDFIADYPGSDEADVDDMLDEIARRLHDEVPPPGLVATGNG
jgi:Mn-dependent DtxR family transcriptional regulator